MNLLDKLQLTLDTLLLEHGINSFWQTFEPLSQSERPKEYVIFTIDGVEGTVYADDTIINRSPVVTIRYYYALEFLKTYNDRQNIFKRIESIVEAMLEQGFVSEEGFADEGDIDDVGMNTSVGSFVGELWQK